MFCFAEDNEIISGIENRITEPDWKKTGLSTHFLLSGVADQTATYCLSLHYIFFVSLVSKFSVTHRHCLITFT